MRFVHYTNRLSVLITDNMWLDLEAYYKVKGLTGKSAVIRHLLEGGMKSLLGALNESEKESFKLLRDGIDMNKKLVDKIGE